MVTLENRQQREFFDVKDIEIIYKHKVCNQKKLLL